MLKHISLPDLKRNTLDGIVNVTANNLYLTPGTIPKNTSFHK